MLKTAGLSKSQKDFGPKELSQAAELMQNARGVTKEKYEELASTFPNVDFADFWKFETEFDSTSGSQVMACVGGSCLI